MKYILTLLIVFTLFHQFPNGQWIFGALYEEPKVAIAINSEGECAKYDGESKPCTLEEFSILLSLME